MKRQLFPAALLLLTIRSLHAQTDLQQPPVIPDVPKIYCEALGFASGQQGVSRLDVYTEIPYDALRFLRDGDLFRATYELSMEIRDSTGKLADEKWWKETIETRSYDESVSPRAGKISHKSFLLAPGRYTVAVQVKDAETDKTSRIERNPVVKDYFIPPFSISDLMLVSKVDTEGGKTIAYPIITGNIGDLKSGTYIVFEMYNSINADSAQANITIRDIRGAFAVVDSFTQILGVPRLTFMRREPTDKLMAGDYMAEVSIRPYIHGALSIEGSMHAFASRPLSIRWRNVPVTINDLDKAIEEMQYIAQHDELDDIKHAPPEKKKELFYDFWKRRDPTPGTDRNELMDEYYSRVDYANRHFSHYMEGWKTDMGMIYIIFGAPNGIERHPFEIDSKPYEIWSYYDQNREFVFVDATGFGDYRLQNPVWDLYRTRPR